MSGAEMLNALVDRVQGLPEAQKKELAALAAKRMAEKPFAPNPGPQTDAYYSEADEMLYGGEPGGGKSALLIGLGVNEHSSSLILRRNSVNLTGLIDEAARCLGGRDYIAGKPPVAKLPKGVGKGGRIEFGHCQYEHDREAYQGRAHTLKGFDELTQFLESQYTYIIAWNRSADGERCRVVATTNAPTGEAGRWVVKRWAPWLDDTHPDYPEESGKLRWYTSVKGVDTEVDLGEDGFAYLDGELLRDFKGNPLKPKSRTFIRSSLDDNPDLAETGYAANLEAMTGDEGKILREGDFNFKGSDDPYQVIPTEWVRAAQARWTPDGWDGLPMTALGVDVAHGGKDETVLAARHGFWYAPLDRHPGTETPDGPSVAGLCVGRARDGALIRVDVVGWGASAYEHLKGQGATVQPLNAASKSAGRTREGQSGFVNLRAELWWRFREALDPTYGDPICLPPDTALFGALTAPLFEFTPRGIRIEAKEEIKLRLGRSTDDADAVIMAWWRGQGPMQYRNKGSRQTTAIMDGRRGGSRQRTAIM